MKKFNFFRTIMATAAVVVAMSVVACDPDDKKGGNGDEPGSDELSGTISDDVTLDEYDTYKLVGPLLVGDGASLTIPAGTTIKAKTGFSSYILVLQGGQIFVNGTATAPVTMTIEDGAAATARWGGLVINGYAPLEDPEFTGSTEISPNYSYGGDKPGDDSGDITFLKLLYTGAQNNESTEHNGLTLNGVGNGTKIEDIFVKDGSDDGIEFFGGSVNVKRLLVVNSDDDMFDFTLGYNGTLTDAYGVWEAGFNTGESDASGVEADGNFDGETPDAPDMSDFTITNMTIDLRLAYDDATIGADVATGARRTYMQNAIRLRRLGKATITNALVTGTGCVENLINLDGGDTFGADETSEISVTDGLGNDPKKDIKFNGAVGTDPAKTAADYPGVVIETGNAGCSKAHFAWTGYAL